MDNADRESLAWARFEAFRDHPPAQWDERAVAQFHEVVSALEEAYALDLSSFRIPNAEMKSRIVGASRLGRSGRSRPPQISNERYCDEQFARRQMEGIAFYFQNVQSLPERQKFGF